nr:M23 family metallopeptidase [Novosphingobium sp.]
MTDRRAALAGLSASLGTLLASARPIAAAVPPIAILAGKLTQGGWARGQMANGSSLKLDGAPVPVDRSGGFFIAFDRDAGPSAMLAGTAASGSTTTLPLTIAPRQWQIEHINLPMRPGALPDEEFLRRRAAELAQINAARAQNRPSEGWRQAMTWPLTGRLSGRFGSQRIYRGMAASYHSGLDIARPAGVPFAAPADGVVVLAAVQAFTLEGHLLLIDHGMGLNSAFLHCSALNVGVGDTVRQGQAIGRVGMTGRATGPHLHWSIKWRAAKLDPLLFLGAMPTG